MSWEAGKTHGTSIQLRARQAWRELPFFVAQD
jgi:hypothetical protein